MTRPPESPHAGRTDIPLTETGRAQADQLSAVVSRRAFNLVLTIPLQRARETCERFCLADSASLDDRFMEWDYCVYEGRTTADIRESLPEWAIWTYPVTDVESLRTFEARVDPLLQTISTLGSERDNRMIRHWNEGRHLYPLESGTR